MLPNISYHHPRTADELVTQLASALLLLLPFLFFIGSAGAEVALSGIAVCFLLHSAFTKQWSWLRDKWFLCLGLLWLYMTLRGVFAEQPREALHRSLPFIRYAVFAAALAHWLMRASSLRRLFLYSLTASISFIMLDGLIQWKIGYDLFGRDILPDALGHVRLTGPFGQTKPIMGIMLTWLSFPVCLHFLLNEEGKLYSGKALLGSAAFCLAALGMIALSGERMALLLALLGWAVTFLLIGVTRRMLMGIILAGMITLGIMAVAIPDMFQRQVLTTIDTFSHWQESPYGKLMSSDLKLSAQNPVFGLGANHFRIACPELYPNADKDFLAGVCNIHPHNMYFEWLIEEGLIGLALFLAFVAQLFARCRRDWQANRHNALFVGWCVAFALRIWPIGSTTGFFSNWGAPPFWLAAGMLLAYTSAAEARNDDAHPILPL